MRRVGLVLLTLVVLLATAGCGPNPEKCRTDKALLEDSFNDTACGWGEYDRAEASAGYVGSEYFVSVHQPNTSAVAVPGISVDNVTLQAEARLAGGSPNNNLGLVCRYQDMEHFYAFMISSDGYYAIVQVADGAGYRILSGDGQNLLPSEAIETGPEAVNEIHAVCTGETLTLYVNGQQLASVSDDLFSSGDVGFIVSTYEEGPTEVRFDNLIVLEPVTPSPVSD